MFPIYSVLDTSGVASKQLLQSQKNIELELELVCQNRLYWPSINVRQIFRKTYFYPLKCQFFGKFGLLTKCLIPYYKCKTLAPPDLSEINVSIIQRPVSRIAYAQSVELRDSSPSKKSLSENQKICHFIECCIFQEQQ